MIRVGYIKESRKITRKDGGILFLNKVLFKNEVVTVAFFSEEKREGAIALSQDGDYWAEPMTLSSVEDEAVTALEKKLKIS